MLSKLLYMCNYCLKYYVNEVYLDTYNIFTRLVFYTFTCSVFYTSSFIRMSYLKEKSLYHIACYLCFSSLGFL